ncbi:unnamed protein product [Arctogadus glacialis]
MADLGSTITSKQTVNESATSFKESSSSHQLCFCREKAVETWRSYQWILPRQQTGRQTRTTQRQTDKQQRERQVMVTIGLLHSSSSHPGSVLTLDSTTAPSAGCVQFACFCPGHTPCRCSDISPLPASSVAVPPLPLAPHPPGQLCSGTLPWLGTLEELAIEEPEEKEDHA